MLFQKCVVRTEPDIYVFIQSIYIPFIKRQENKHIVSINGNVYQILEYNLFEFHLFNILVSIGWNVPST